MHNGAVASPMKPAPSKVKKGRRQQTSRPQPRPTAWARLAGSQYAALAGVVAITALVYLRCLGNGYVFDDHGDDHRQPLYRRLVVSVEGFRQ